ncbi:sigma factor regulatory protein, FecR/PupR family [Bacteriovorax sp. BSW11_IV]|uniref:FecR family protein n=1 Tax=Bacteriovorax sp. BSW11_IV TaxID=1353529 RepID=UPI00038A4D27|nr:FecR family protein [Bacteriovorax sp. BSW11_IV]EQC44096.1 sigma factor regulatory protein, FecR/PupR family [Bacteriovorax sp. BSW11_IV]
MRFLTTFSFLLLSFTSLYLFATDIVVASENGVAKAIIVRGDVSAKIDGKMTKINKNDWLPEGAVVQTQDKSFVKFLLIDKSQMNLGPNSQMEISAFPQKDAGIITLMKGQLRSKVTKDYMKMDDKDRSKLFIKTKTAAMGVRGTDFQVNYSPENDNTTLITFEGAVAMGQIDAIEKARSFSQKNLESIVSGPNAVMVKQGQFSGVAPARSNRPNEPIKINPAQFDVLKKNETGAETPAATSETTSATKTFKSPIPPGVNSKEFANDTSAVAKQVAGAVGADNMKKAMAIKGPKDIKFAPPEGFKDKETGAFAPPSGGFVDLKTAQYIPPPAGSAFDAVTKTYVPPKEMGTFNARTGQYVNTTYKLMANGNMVLNTNSRLPASTDPKAPPKPPVMNINETKPMEPIPLEGPELVDGTRPLAPPPEFNSDVLVEDRDKLIEQTNNTVQQSRTSRVKVIIRSQ